MLQRFTGFWRMSSGNDDEKNEGRGRKVPQGFEKILKRTRKGITHDKKPDEEKTAAPETEDEALKKEEEEKKEEEAEQSDREEDEKDKKKKEDTEENQGWRQKVYGFFMEPNGGGPNYENWLKVVVLGGLFGYYALMMKPASQEITYMDFVQNYLSQNKVEMITLCEDKNNASYKYRAIVETTEGEKVHLVLPQVENFLMKLDMA